MTTTKKIAICVMCDGEGRVVECEGPEWGSFEDMVFFKARCPHCGGSGLSERGVDDD